ncbi:MAG: ATP-binding cassette domain-containing protein, partial [Clostridiaceae bacterium]|nr:ATP-binding cassette domain-containing protein [Clostridiaceae bacterium]
GTIAENIAYARPEAARQDIVDAAIAAHAHQFICKLPDGYDTLVGTGGRQLSGGERQRLSIARAILANPKILVLDEATASVDTETERAIQTSLNELVKGRTTLSIAHRLSTLKGADRIIVLENGRLTEAGTHQELIARRGAYFNLMELQTKALAMRGID